MFRPQTQSAPGYGRKAISTAPVVPGLEDVIASNEPLSGRKLPIGAYSVRPYVDFYKTQMVTAKVTSEKVQFPSKPLSVQQAWANAEDENRKVAAALRKASPPVSELVLFKDIYRQRPGYLPDSIAQAGDAITAAALVYINRGTQPPGTQPPVVTPGTQPPMVGPGTQPPMVGPGTQPPVVGPGTQPPVVGPGTQPPVVGPGTQPPVVGPGTQPPVVTPGTQPPVVGPGGSPFIPPATLPTTGNVPVQPPSVPTGTGVVPAGQPASQTNQIVSVIGAGNAVMAYFQNNSGTVGPVEILNPGSTPSTIETITQFIGPVTLSNRGDEQYFIVPPSNVDPGEARAWFGPPSTTFQGGIAMPGSVALYSPITAMVIGGGQSQTITIGPALGVNTAVQLKLPDGIISEKQQIDTVDRAYGNQSTALVVYNPKQQFASYTDLVKAIAPDVVSAQAPPSYPRFVLDIINAVIYDGAQSIEAWGLIDGGDLSSAEGMSVNPLYDWLYSTSLVSPGIKSSKLFNAVMLRCRSYGFLPEVPILICNFVYTEAAYDQLVKFQRSIFPDVTRAGTLPAVAFTYDSASANASIDKAFGTLEQIGTKMVKAAFMTMTSPADPTKPAMTDAQIADELRSDFTSDPPEDPAKVNETLTTTSLYALLSGAYIGYLGDKTEMVMNTLEVWGPLFFKVPGGQYIRAILYDRRVGHAIRNGLVFSGIAGFSVAYTLFNGYSSMAALGLCAGLVANVMGRFARQARMARPITADIMQPDQNLIGLVENNAAMVKTVADAVVRLLVIERTRGLGPNEQDARLAGLVTRFSLYSEGIDVLRPGGGPGMGSKENRLFMRGALKKVLLAFGIPGPEIDGVLDLMKSKGKDFQFYTLVPRGANAGKVMINAQLYELLNRNKETFFAFIDDYLEEAAVSGGDSEEFRTDEAKKFLFRFNLKGASPLQIRNWSVLLGIIYGIPPERITAAAQELPDPPPLEGDDALGPNATATGGPIQARTGDGSAPGMFDRPITATTGDGSGRADGKADGGATMTSVPTPQFTDPPAKVTLENAMSQLADRTLSVQQITRSRAPDRYQWWMIKARRRTLRSLFFAVFTGLGATPADSTQVLNFMDPSFVDASLNTQQYSGLRIQGRHGSYPRLDAFFLKYFDTFSKYFAGLSSRIRVSYASTIAMRIFGSRGKSYFQKLFALSPAELSQVAKNSAEVLDIVTGDTTFSDEFPEGPAPTAEEARGYQTGPIDYFGPP